MATGAYRLLTDRFDALVLEHGYRSIQHFCNDNRISRSSLDDMRRGNHEPSLTNVRKVLDGFANEYTFARLFEPTPSREWAQAA